jgi:Fe-S oxidoreductase
MQMDSSCTSGSSNILALAECDFIPPSANLLSLADLETQWITLYVNGIAKATRLKWPARLPKTQLAVRANNRASSPRSRVRRVGCAGSFDERNQKVNRSFASLTKQAGVRFAILGSEETCTGDPARRLANEYFYTTVAGQY